MYSLPYCILFFATVNAARVRRHDGDCAAPTTAAAIVHASNTVRVPSNQPSNLVISVQPSNPTTHIEYVYISEYTTVWPTPTPEDQVTPSPNVIGTSNLTTLASQIKACSARSSNSTGKPSRSGQYSSASLSRSLIPYGSGLPAPSFLLYFPGVLIASMQPTPSVAVSSLAAVTSLPQYPSSPAAASVGQSTNTSTPSPPPPASSAHSYCKRKSTTPASAEIPLSIPHFTYDPLPESSTAPAVKPTPPTMPPSSTAVVIVPITPTPNILLANTSPQPYGQWEWSPWKRADEFGIHDTDETSTMTSTTTTEVTVTTRLASVSRTSKLACTSADTSKTPQTLPTSTPTGDVLTSVLPPDIYCYYPYPGGVCGPAKTTLVTKTKAVKPESTQTSWCAYPGQKC
jgi:hypothetical protein